MRLNRLVITGTIFKCGCMEMITTSHTLRRCLREHRCTCVCAWGVDVPATHTQEYIQYQTTITFPQLKFHRANKSLRLYWTSIVSQMARSIFVNMSHQREGVGGSVWNEQINRSQMNTNTQYIYNKIDSEGVAWKLNSHREWIHWENELSWQTSRNRRDSSD